MSEIKELHYVSDLGELVERPWGTYQTIEETSFYKIKRITVKPGAKLSLQSHEHRSEHWVIVQGEGVVTKNEEEITLKYNESVYLEVGTVHRMTNNGDVPVIFIEIQTGEYLGEDDIKRYEDIYGRV